MIEGGASFVTAAYAVAIGGLAVLTIIVALRAWHWAKLARALERKAP
jgi:hypothetical protein